MYKSDLFKTSGIDFSYTKNPYQCAYHFLASGFGRILHTHFDSLHRRQAHSFGHFVGFQHFCHELHSSAGCLNGVFYFGNLSWCKNKSCHSQFYCRRATNNSARPILGDAKFRIRIEPFHDRIRAALNDIVRYSFNCSKSSFHFNEIRIGSNRGDLN